jgi:putative restriction endonuclease
MLLIEPGDVVFSHYAGAIRAVGVVMATAEPTSRPDFQFANQFWDADGWQVDVEFQILTDPFDPKTMLDEYQQLGPTKYGPISSAGKANMEYLYSVPTGLGALYERSIGVSLIDIKNDGLAERMLETVDDASDELVNQLRKRKDIGPTEIRALTLARRGQGYFKKEVERIEHACRLTGVTERRHLRASHIKPWRASNDVERLEGDNGLLLSPHVDHLFDQGYITFRKNGAIVQGEMLSADIPSKWNLDLTKNVGNFNRRQDTFLEYHRDVIFDNELSIKARAVRFERTT